MTKFDVSKQHNTDPYILWKQLVNKLRTYEDIVYCELFVDGKKTGVKVQFKSSTKIYPYIEKAAVIRLLKPEDKAYWQDLPF